MAYIKRNIYAKMDELLGYFPCLVIYGSRQCGKTVLSKMLRPNWKYFDLENPQTYDKIHDDLNFFFKQNNTDIIIDETQLSPKLFQQLRGVIDEQRELNNRFILTGSSSPELLKNTTETLAGRVAMLELSPFKANELFEQPLSSFYSIFNQDLNIDNLDYFKSLKPSISQHNLFQCFLNGGYPTPFLSKNDIFHKNWMEQYFINYISRDIKNLFPKMDSIKFRRFSTMLTALSGTIINRSQLGRSLDVNESTIKNYLDIAHNTMVWRNIPSYNRSKIKSIIKMPKGIFRDSGINNYLQDLSNYEKLNNSPFVGQNFESFIIEEIIRGIQSSRASHWEYSYFRTKSGSEVDLIISGEFGILPIEIKYGSSTRRKQLIGLQKFIKDNQLAYGIVINNAEHIELISDNIIQIPATFI